MEQMQADLGTRLDWVAVDHFNTGHPHSHVVIRGTDDRGGDLIIAQDYITAGLRHRAEDLATRNWATVRRASSAQPSVNRARLYGWVNMATRMLRSHSACRRLTFELNVGLARAQAARTHPPVASLRQLSASSLPTVWPLAGDPIKPARNADAETAQQETNGTDP